MRELVERVIEDGRITTRAPGRAAGRSVTVNLAESPLAWLAARGHVSARKARRASGCAPITRPRSWGRA